MSKKVKKQIRMQIRRDIGNRVLKQPIKLLKYPDYLIAHACFKCRKSFKKPLTDKKFVCPQCGEELREMGRTFKTPKTKDIEQWAKVERLWNAGFRFVGCGSSSSPAFPKRLKEVDQFIANNPDHPLRIIRD